MNKTMNKIRRRIIKAAFFLLVYSTIILVYFTLVYAWMMWNHVDKGRTCEPPFTCMNNDSHPSETAAITLILRREGVV